MADFKVVRIAPDGWRRFRSIRLRALADAPDAFGSTLAVEERLTDEQWRTRVENEAVAHLVAVSDDGTDLGVAVGAPFTERKRTAGLFSMWVAPEARQQGHAVALVRAIVAWAQGEGYRQLILEVADANDAAIRLYESCGFVPTGRTGTLPPPRQHILEHEMAMNFD